MITWQERELSERLRNEFEKRGFYQLGYAPTEFAPTPYGFRSRENCTKFLSILKEEYEYIAFKNMAVKTGTADEQTVSACMFVKLGSLSREPCPVAEDTWWRSVRTLIVEGRWPEKEFISGVRFMDDAMEKEYGISKED